MPVVVCDDTGTRIVMTITRGMMERGVIRKGWRGLWSVDEVDGGGVCCSL
jgi:hypothetical protein